MPPNVVNPTGAVWTEVAPGAGFTVVGGAAGFIDTDVSTMVTRGVALFAVYPVGAQAVGVRALGSAVATNFNAAAGVTVLGGMARVVGGHCELYRAAADNVYLPVGYFEP